MRTSSDWLAARHAWTPGTVLFGALVGFVGCLVALVFRTEIVASDPVSYVRAALNFPDDSWVPLGYTRYGMILPRLPLAALSGESQLTYYFWPVVFTGLIVACTYLVAFRFWGWMFGLLGVVLSLSSAITFLNLSRGYPDLQSTSLFTAAVIVSLVIRDRLVDGRTAPWWTWLTVGLLLGWAFETRETTILTWPVVAMVLWVRPIALRGLVFLAAGIAAWAVADVMIGWLAYDDPWIRIHAFTKQDLAATANQADQAARTELVGRSRWYYFFGAVPGMLAQTANGWLTLLLGVLGLAGLAFRGGARFTAIWFLLSYVTYAGITGGFFPDHPSGRIDIQRYWISFLPVLGLAAAGTTAELARVLAPRLRRHGDERIRRAAPHVAAGLTVLLALTSLVSLTAAVATNPQYVVSGGDQLSQLRARLEAEPDLLQGRELFTDLATRRVLGAYLRPPLGGEPVWQGRVVDLMADGRQPRKGDIVVVNSLAGGSCLFCQEWLVRWTAARGPIPEDWQEIRASSPRNLVLYRVG